MVKIVLATVFPIIWEDVTFFSVEAHPPICGPSFKLLQIILEFMMIYGGVYFSVQEAQSSANRRTYELTLSGKVV